MQLTKSLIAAYDQCPKRLWLEVNEGAPDRDDPQGGLRKAEGERVGAIARSLLPDGVLVQPSLPRDEALAKTQQCLASDPRVPIFEAAFLSDDTYVRVDILAPLQDGSWHLIEVKSATSVKDHYAQDLATQVYVARGAGLPIGRVSIWHIDNTFVLETEGRYDGLFADRSEIDGMDDLIEGRASAIAAAFNLLDRDEPARDMGDHCTSPYDCPFQERCASALPPPPEWATSLLPNVNGKKAAAKLAEEGLDDLLKVPVGHFDNPVLDRVHQATVSGVPFHDADAIKAKIASWRYPLHFLDFETIQFAAPRWIGTRAYAQIPFQFSNHILQTDGTVGHHEFLDLSGEDPRRACSEALVDSLCAPEVATGSVVAYSASFEKLCIKSLALAFSDLSDELMALHDRVVDLLPIVRNHYYHRDQRGSWSIKAVLPTVCPQLGYADLEVKDGTNAQVAYMRGVEGGLSDLERSAIGDALKAYCQRDTLAMVKLLRALA
ncbi:DUF2779 domain-containing protein [Parvularcula oceani]|uniref:DUF2779 domain-containing protein n=1 Tax=Parvularcula oceani TaxID=1247963 RepID=UPI0004E1CF74|nr:DUF2779 domain-containing protein [Parvularcula oceani]